MTLQPYKDSGPFSVVTMILSTIVLFAISSVFTLSGPVYRWPFHLAGSLLQGVILFRGRVRVDAKEALEQPRYLDWLSFPAFLFAGASIYIALQAARYCIAPVVKGDDMEAAYFGFITVCWTLALGFFCSAFAAGRRVEGLVHNLAASAVVTVSAIVIIIYTSL